MDITDFFAHKRFNVGKRVEVMPRTRTRYVENASQSYGVPLVPEKVLFILDDTLLGSGRDGCVIAIMGIAFNGMFQQPIYFPFDKIEKIQVIGRAVVVNQDAYMQEFSVVGEQDLQAVFLAVKEWLDYRDSRKVDYEEYAGRMYYIQEGFRSRFVPMIKELMNRGQGGTHFDDFMELVDESIQDIERLQTLVAKQALQLDDVDYIDGLCDVIGGFEISCDEDDAGFDEALLQLKRHDAALGQLIKHMLKGVIKGAQNREEEDRKRDRYRDYFGLV